MTEAPLPGDYPSLNMVSKEFTFEHEGKTWDFKAIGLANNTGLTNKVHPFVWLDWHDAYGRPSVARILPFFGGEDAPQGVEAVQLLSDAILAYDSLMTIAVCNALTGETIQRIYDQRKIPRPEVVEVYPNEAGIGGLFGALVHTPSESHPTEIVINWEYLVGLARAGELVEAHRNL